MLALVRRTGTEFGIAVIVASHLLGEIERVCDYLVAIDAGGSSGRRRSARSPSGPASLAVEVEEGAERLAAALVAAGLEATADGRTVLVDARSTSGRATWSATRSPSSGLPLVRIEQRRRGLEELFRMTPPTAGRDAGEGPAASTTSGYQGYDGPRLGRRPRPSARCCRRCGLPTGSAAAAGPRSCRSCCSACRCCRRCSRSGSRPWPPRRVRAARSRTRSPIRHDTYQNLTSTLVMLFCAAQAPELFGRDQRYGVLPLYFSRVLTRIDYAFARAGGLFLAIFVISIVPAAHPDASARSWRRPTR